MMTVMMGAVTGMLGPVGMRTGLARMMGRQRTGLAGMIYMMRQRTGLAGMTYMMRQRTGLTRMTYMMRMRTGLTRMMRAMRAMRAGSLSKCHGTCHESSYNDELFHIFYFVIFRVTLPEYNLKPDAPQ